MHLFNPRQQAQQIAIIRPRHEWSIARIILRWATQVPRAGSIATVLHAWDGVEA